MARRAEAKAGLTAKLRELARKHGCINEADFEMASPFDPGKTMSLFELVGMFRNQLMHGHTHLLPAVSLQMMRLCAQLIEKLFPRAAEDTEQARRSL